MDGAKSRCSQAFARALALVLSAALAGLPGCSRESEAPAPAPASTEAAAPEPAAAPAAVTVASDDTKAMVAPIALYPDPVLELVLQGATQPAQIVLAARFLDAYAKDPSLQPDEGFDTAIVGLLNTPRIVGMMNESLDWTTDLGESVAEDLPGVQLAVQELRWSAYNQGILASNEWQDVVVNGGIVAILPAQRDQLAIPEYDGAALLEAAEPADAAVAPAAAPGAPAAAPAPAAAVAPAAVPVSYSEPQSSFWTNAAIFAGGAALGGLIGYWIGDDDDDDDHYHGGWYGYDDDWDNRPWKGGHNKIKVEGDVIINPAQPGAALRPNRPITRPATTRPGRPGRPAQPGLPGPVLGGKQPGKGSQLARPAARPGPAGPAPARPKLKPEHTTRDVAMPRPANAKPMPAQRDLARAKGGEAKRTRDAGGDLSPGRSNPQVQRDRERGAASRQQAKTPSSASVKKAPSGGKRAALDRSSASGGKRDTKAASRGKKSRRR